MPRLNATRPTAVARPLPRAKAKKPSAQQDRLTSRKLFYRRVRRSVKPGLWLLGIAGALALGSEIFRAMPAVGPVISPAGSLRAGFGGLAAAAGFRIENIQVNGADTTSVPAIVAALGVAKGDPSLGFSLQAAAARIAQLGPVKTAVVQRALPGTIIVTISERAPYAIWQTAGADGAATFVLIDKAGNVIADQDAAAAKRRNPALLLLAGADAPQNAGALLLQLAAAPDIKSRVAAATRVAGLRWNLLLKNQTVVKLPADDTPNALAQLETLQTSMALLDRPVESIDLRMAGRMVVHPYPVSSGHT